MRSILVVLALIGGVIAVHAGECYDTKQAIKMSHPGEYYRWDHHQPGFKGKLCYYRPTAAYAKASIPERKVMPTGTRSVHTPAPEIRPVSATPAAHLMPLAWPDARVITMPWADDFDWMVGGPTYASKVEQVFASLGVK